MLSSSENVDMLRRTCILPNKEDHALNSVSDTLDEFKANRKPFVLYGYKDTPRLFSYFV